MKHARTLLAPLALLLSLTPVSPVATTAATTGQPDVATVTHGERRHEPWHADYPASRALDVAMVYAQTAGQLDDLTWALARYSAAGLELPYVEAWLHDRRSACESPVGQGRSGFATWRDGVSIVFGCGTRHTLLHELGHVYDRYTLSDADREAFMALRGVTAWQDAVWLQSGQEHLADVLAWALSPTEEQHAQTQPRDAASLTAAYELATGFEPFAP